MFKIKKSKNYGLIVTQNLKWTWASLLPQVVKNPPVRQETPDRFLDQEDHWRRDRLPTPVFLGFPVSQLVKNLPAMQENWVQSLGWEDHLEKGKSTLSSILAWRILWSHKELFMTE